MACWHPSRSRRGQYSRPHACALGPASRSVQPCASAYCTASRICLLGWWLMIIALRNNYSGRAESVSSGPDRRLLPEPERSGRRIVALTGLCGLLCQSCDRRGQSHFRGLLPQKSGQSPLTRPQHHVIKLPLFCGFPRWHDGRSGLRWWPGLARRGPGWSCPGG